MMIALIRFQSKYSFEIALNTYEWFMNDINKNSSKYIKICKRWIINSEGR